MGLCGVKKQKKLNFSESGGIRWGWLRWLEMGCMVDVGSLGASSTHFRPPADIHGVVPWVEYFNFGLGWGWFWWLEKDPPPLPHTPGTQIQRLIGPDTFWTRAIH